MFSLHISHQAASLDTVPPPPQMCPPELSKAQQSLVQGQPLLWPPLGTMLAALLWLTSSRKQSLGAGIQDPWATAGCLSSSVGGGQGPDTLRLAAAPGHCSSLVVAVVLK